MTHQYPTEALGSSYIECEVSQYPPPTGDAGTATPIDDLREAVKTLVETERIARRVLGGSHPITKGIEYDLQKARAALTAREPKK